MNNETFRILLLGGSGYIGKILYSHFKELDFDITLTYYEHKPEWARHIDTLYFNASSYDNDESLLNTINEYDAVINLMQTHNEDAYEDIFYNTPLKLAKACDSTTKFITLNKNVNKFYIDNKAREYSKKLQDSLIDQSLSAVISCAPVICKESNLFKIIERMTPFRLVPVFGDATNRIRPLHKVDFCLALTQFVVTKDTLKEHFILLGGDKHNVRHIYNLISKKPPFFIPVSQRFFLKHRKSFEQLYEIEIENEALEVLGYEENHFGSDLGQYLNQPILSFDARVKREGLN